jgi:hypothetical protein
MMGWMEMAETMSTYAVHNWQVQERENLVALGGDGRIPLIYVNWEENLRHSD